MSTRPSRPSLAYRVPQASRVHAPVRSAPRLRRREIREDLFISLDRSAILGGSRVRLRTAIPSLQPIAAHDCAYALGGMATPRQSVERKAKTPEWTKQAPLA